MKVLAIVLCVCSLVMLCGGAIAMSNLGTIVVDGFTTVFKPTNPDGSELSLSGIGKSLIYDIAFATGVYAPVIVAHMIGGLEERECKTHVEMLIFRIGEFGRICREASEENSDNGEGFRGGR